MNKTESAITPLLIDAAAITNGRSVTPDMLNRSFQAILTGTATALIQGSNDPAQAAWVTLSTITASGGFTSNDPYKYIRARVSDYTSGTVSVYMGT